LGLLFFTSAIHDQSNESKIVLNEKLITMVKVTQPAVPPRPQQTYANDKSQHTDSRSRSGSSSPLRYQSVMAFAEQFPLSREDIKIIIGIPVSTQFRYQKENLVLKPTIADRFERLQRIYHQALDLFEDQDETKRWLTTPHESLEGKTPLQALATDSGAKQVEAILYRAEYGMFG
jgi:putative toxin-antitoxin system antitoxin component (TIGR02293 family)